MPKSFHNRLKNIIKESLDDLAWVKDVKPPNLDFSFDGKEHWVDVSKIDSEGRKKIVNHIKKTVPNYEEFEHDMLNRISSPTYFRRGNYKGIIVHCGSDRTDYEPEENLLCSAYSNYEDDYEMDNPYADISKSIYIDGQDLLDYITVFDEEELDESLEWSDKDTPFDEKDKSFENDPSWKNDEDWSLNPERSYWKQGDAGGSGGGDMNESNELQWIKDVPNTIPPIERRNKISLKDFLVDIMKDDVDLLDFLVSEGTIRPTNEYMRTGNGGEGWTPEDWDDFGYDEWAGDGHWVDNHRWMEEPQFWNYEIRESMELTDGIWKTVEWDTTDYDLERGTHEDRMVFKRKSDDAYFALNFSGSHYDGIEDWGEELYQVFPRKITKLIYESKLIKRIIKEEVEGIDVAYEDDNLVVIHPKTREASCHYGGDTRWCTAAEGGESFDEYNSSGNLYYYLWKFKMPPRLQNFQKIARLVDYGKEYGETGEFFLFDDSTMRPYDILFNILQGKKDGNSFTYPNKLKPINESWERALIAVDTHYAKNGLHKTSSEHNNDDDGNWYVD